MLKYLTSHFAPTIAHLKYFLHSLSRSSLLVYKPVQSIFLMEAPACVETQPLLPWAQMVPG